MKYAKKMVLVDVDDSASRSVITKSTSQISELDKKMSLILNNNELTDYDKCNLYMETFSKYLFFKHQQQSIEEQKWLDLNNRISSLTQAVLKKPTKTYIRKSELMRLKTPRAKEVEEMNSQSCPEDGCYEKSSQNPIITLKVPDQNLSSEQINMISSQESLPSVNVQNLSVSDHPPAQLKSIKKPKEILPDEKSKQKKKSKESTGIVDWVSNTKAEK